MAASALIALAVSRFGVARAPLAAVRAPLVARSRLLRMNAPSPSVGALYDVPVSNNGARCRMVLYYKGVPRDEVAVVSPAELGGLKAPAFLAANPQGKMPLLTLAGSGEPLPESDTIARYLCARFAGRGPALQPSDPLAAARSDRICRLHDIYLAAVQPALYKVAGSAGAQAFPPFGPFGSRQAALAELTSQLAVLESYADERGPYLVGAEPTLADCTIWPSAIFWQTILPKFGMPAEAIFGPRLSRWATHMMGADDVGARVSAEIRPGLLEWEEKQRWAPILGAGTRDTAGATIFDSILDGKIPADVVYEDELVLAFRDIAPVAPTHVLLIPKRRDGLTQLQRATAEHKHVLGHMLAVAVPAIVAKDGLDSYRLVVNDGAQACQSVFHLHMHIIGGKALTWPPGV
ncbi:hypothetical protein KFE25_000694 [Diacronema lutheri]|uniref:HIT domain-containing protein n=1 Tax=Diacronema lutheri TaxID=2081491 RepID=A0A8J6CH52_DIALT|nr:hypothetical protein KFE25_000694 [Diacronema lutheri]